MDYVINSDGVLVPADSLYHWGIKGMKWGVRRYQNKDGSLTPAGKKRYAEEDAEDSDTTPKKKSVSEMTDDEIRSAIARKQLENAYNQYHPQPKKPDSFAKKFIDEAVKPAAINAGKDLIEKTLKKATGDILKDKVDPNSLAGLESANKKLAAQLENKLLKMGINPNIKSDNLTKWQEFNDRLKAEEDAKKTEKADAKAAKEKAAEEKKRLEEEMRKYQDYNDNWYDRDNPTKSQEDGTYSKRGGDREYVEPGVKPGHELAIYTPESISVGRSYTSESSIRDLAVSSLNNNPTTDKGYRETHDLLDQYGNVILRGEDFE